MDTLKILLGGTLALVIGALIVFANQLNQGVADSSPEEIEAMRRDLSEMERELDRLKLERERRVLNEAAESSSAPAVAANDRDAAESEDKVEDLEARLKRIEAEAEAAKEETKRAEAEADLLTERHSESRSKTQRRARVINDALVIATIQEWLEDPEFGGFATLEIERPDSVQSGTVLALRRNSGILGKFRVGEVTFEGAIANPITAFDEVKPERGDELILNSVVEMAN